MVAGATTQLSTAVFGKMSPRLLLGKDSPCQVQILRWFAGTAITGSPLRRASSNTTRRTACRISPHDVRPAGRSARRRRGLAERCRVPPALGRCSRSCARPAVVRPRFPSSRLPRSRSIAAIATRITAAAGSTALRPATAAARGSNADKRARRLKSRASTCEAALRRLVESAKAGSRRSGCLPQQPRLQSPGRLGLRAHLPSQRLRTAQVGDVERGATLDAGHGSFHVAGISDWAEVDPRDHVAGTQAEFGRR